MKISKEKYDQLDPYLKGQVDLIEDIQDNLTSLLDNKTEGFDLALDIINLLKNIHPVNKKP